jgi:hypothetical protein
MHCDLARCWEDWANVHDVAFNLKGNSKIDHCRLGNYKRSRIVGDKGMPHSDKSHARN